ncbi:unnamed protein product [Caenorhabditis angaria]|uniref:Uncharacterized protein n=1 Tax=Caenorhabditis angaria TaxID=860376 RepID=A0A9P1IZU4_9PELO|nr:unnamed protein product [Caenorhabditis angaria]
MSAEEDLHNIQLQNSIDNNQTLCIDANDEYRKHGTFSVDETDEYLMDFVQNDNAILNVKLDVSMEQICTEIAKEPFPDFQQNLVDENNPLAGNCMIQAQIPQQIDNNANLGEQIEQIPTNVNGSGNNELQEHNIS